MIHLGPSQSLESLLEKALDDLTIEVGPTQREGVNGFRTLLRLNRSGYAPVLRRVIFTAQIKVNNSETENAIFEAINTILAEFIQDGQIFSCVVDHASGRQIEAILRSLLVRAIADSPKIAAQALVDSTTNSSCVFFHYFLITGVRIPEQLEMADGLTIIPLPDSFADFPACIPEIPEAPDHLKNMGIRGLEGKALVRVEFETFPIFHRPEGEYTIASGPESHFKTRLKGENLSHHELDILLQALSLASFNNVKSVMAWQSYTNYEVFDTRLSTTLSRVGPIIQSPGQWSHATTKLDALQTERAKYIYNRLTQNQTNLWKPLSIPISRWAESLNAKDDIDKIIDLCIALESLYVRNSNTEVGFRLALYGAQHLGRDKPHKQEIMETFKTAYDARSSAVHTGKLTNKIKARVGDFPDFIQNVQELCKQGIMKIIDAGEFPDLNDLVLGKDPK